MTTDDVLVQYTLVVDAPDADNDELAELTRRLQDIIAELPIEEVQQHPVLPVPGSKAGLAMAVNAVDVRAAPGLLSALIDAVRNFVSFGTDRRVELAFQIGDRPLVVKALVNELPIVLKALNEYQALSPKIVAPDGMVAALGVMSSTTVTTRSGGVEVEAEHVEVGGSVVGRDQVWSAGGHIIIAKDSAQVIINGVSETYGEYQ